jgi:uncharacterized membrane protein YgdD (TMEM256/DUF423 family)
VKKLFSISALLGFLSVALGAFGAHALKNIFSPEVLSIYQTGVNYQIYHSLASLFSCLAFRLTGESYFKYASIIYIFGILLFSGSLYLITFTGIKKFGLITPAGGVLFLLGWILIFLGGLRSFK